MRGEKGKARSQSNKRPEQRQRHARAWQVHAVRVAGREEIRREKNPLKRQKVFLVVTAGLGKHTLFLYFLPSPHSENAGHLGEFLLRTYQK